MNYSYWEYNEWFKGNDFIIVGSGIVGLNCAIFLKEKYPKSKILILEKGIMPQGASSKNAGFACFGSTSELLNDLNNHSQEEVVELVTKRWEGLQLLRNILGDKNIDYQHKYGYELFLNQSNFDECYSKIDFLNQILFPLFKSNVFKTVSNKFNFKNCIPNYIVNNFEGQIDTGKMIVELLKICQQKNIKILNNTIVKGYSNETSHVKIQTNHGEFISNKLLIASNGFSKGLINENVQPARAQVIITKPINNLKIKGSFHLQEGYYYFRNIDDRILIGGGRNLDFSNEKTMNFGQTDLIQNKLEEILKTIILPTTSFEIDQRWSGIMGVGDKKKPIVKQISNHVFCGVRLGGMGIAIGSLVGRELAALVD